MKTKLCKDCKHFKQEDMNYSWIIDGNCMHPTFQYSKFSRIDGQMHQYNTNGVPVEFAREESKKCGMAGKLWDAKPPRKKTSLLGWLRAS